MSDSFLVHYTLNTLPPLYEPFKISYNAHKKWSVNELLTMCVQEEERLKMKINWYTLKTIVGKDMNLNKSGKREKLKYLPKVELRKVPSVPFVIKSDT